MNNVLFGLIGLLMFAITGIGFTQVREQITARTGTNSLVNSVDTVEGQASADRAIAASGDSGTSAAPVSATVPEVLMDVAARVNTAFLGGSGEDEDENEGDEHEDEDEDERPRTATSPAPSTKTQTQAAVQENVSASFTLAQVAEHSTATNCYSVINGSVYNLTSFVSKHPGGQSAIKSMCGVEGTAAFSGQHGGQGTPTSVLAQYKVGIVK